MKDLYTKITVETPKEVYDFSEPVQRWLLSQGFNRRVDIRMSGEPIRYSHNTLPLRIYVTDVGNYRLSIVDFIYGRREIYATLASFEEMRDLFLKAFELAESFINFVEGEKQ